MKKLSIFLLFSIYSVVLFAHNAQISTMALVQSNDSKWHLILSTSLTAFQYELKNSNPTLNLESMDAEQFQRIILQHLREKIEIEANGRLVALKNARVILGHQTDINFEVDEIPQNIQTLNFQNIGFSTLRDHHCVLKIIRKNGNANTFMLQKDNNFSVSLEDKNNVLVEKVNQNESSTLIYFLTTFVISALLIWYLLTKKHRKSYLNVHTVS